MSSLTNLQRANISEEQVIIAFHSFLQGALSLAHVESLLDAEVLSSAEADIQIAGPAICLFLAALRSEGDPPSIATSLISLDAENCPPSFQNWFHLWSQSVPKIKALPLDLRHDLARMICDQEPQCQPIRIDLPVIAQDLRAIAIEISQRRTFQERFSQDLDYALQFGHDDNTSESRRHAHFHPPPAYGDAIPILPASYQPETDNMANSHIKPNISYTSVSDPTIENHAALGIIRETLYASLTDVLYATPTIFNILQSKQSTDSELSRAYFAALCLAILEVSLNLVNPMEGSVQVVNLGSGYPKVLKATDCPPHLKPLMTQLLLISATVQALADEDHHLAVQHASDGNPATRPKIERLKIDLERGANWQSQPSSQTHDPVCLQSDVRIAANQINSMALKVSHIPSFREREDSLFEILVPCLSERKKS